MEAPFRQLDDLTIYLSIQSWMALMQKFSRSFFFSFSTRSPNFPAKVDATFFVNCHLRFVKSSALLPRRTMGKKSDFLLIQLGENLAKDNAQREELIKRIKVTWWGFRITKKTGKRRHCWTRLTFPAPSQPKYFCEQGVVVFVIDGQEWTLDLREGKGSLVKGPAEGLKPDITLTMTDAVFLSLVSGKLGSQQAFLMRKLKINGSMGLAMKLQPILDAAAAPKSKL